MLDMPNVGVGLGAAGSNPTPLSVTASSSESASKRSWTSVRGELAGQPIPCLDDGVLAGMLVQPSILDRGGGLVGKKRGQLGVAMGEPPFAFLVVDAQHADRALARLHRHRQDRARISQHQALLV